MSRTFSQRLDARSFWSIAAGFVALAAVTACSSGAGTTATDTTSQALSEATASAADTHAAAEACFTAFDACRAAAGADVEACKATLDSCLPAEARPGPHCGPPPGHERPGDGDGAGGGGDCDGGGPPKGAPDGTDAPPPPPPPDGGLPDFCKDVPLPPPAAIAACKAPLDACLSAGTDKKTCFDAAHACIKAAFDAALPPKSS
jgi:hypothetical protein